MNKQPGWFSTFEQHPYRYVGLAILVYLLINNGVNATSVWMEHNRGDGPPGIALWEPFVWEYTSAVSTLCVLPLMFYLFSRIPFHLSQIKRQLAIHIFASIVFSLLHVGLMVVFREVIYSATGGNYQFGDVFTELLYEYRKDALGYVTWFIMFHIYQFIYSRLKGEASLVDGQEHSDLPDKAPEHLLVRKLDKEFLVKVDNIDWLEAAGNYVNLHSEGRIYPLRGSLSSLIPRLESKGFSRVHRSYGINHEKVASIETLASGDAEVLLKSGNKIPVSRRYKEAFKQRLQ